MIAVLVLAAGVGSRLGGEKLLLEVAGEPLIRRGVRTALEAALGPVVVVLAPGAAGARLRAAAGDLSRCVVVENPAPEVGMNGSLALAVRAAPPDAAAALVTLPDMPFVSADQLRALADRWRAAGAPVVASRYGGVLAPPVLYARALLDELASGPPGDGHGRVVTRRHGGEAAFVDFPPGALADVDAPADLERARRAAAGEAT